MRRRGETKYKANDTATDPVTHPLTQIKEDKLALRETKRQYTTVHGTREHQARL
jgi:hypothetical protein